MKSIHMFLYMIYRRTLCFLPKKMLNRVRFTFFVNINKLIKKYLMPKGISSVKANSYKMFVNVNRSGIVFDLLTKSFYERGTTYLIKNLLKPGMIFLDIGANIGYYSLLAAGQVGDKGRVFAFEPEPENLNLLIKNININGFKNITVIKKAVSDVTGTAALYLSDIFDGAHGLFDFKDGRRYILVDTITLDEFFDDNTDIDLIKMDIQGAEALALAGMEKIIKNNPDLKIVTELCPEGIKRCGSSAEEYINKISEYGFKFYLINDRKPWLKYVGPLSIKQMRLVGEESINLFITRKQI